MPKKLLVLLVVMLLLVALAPAAAQGGGTLVGAFDVGPGGAPKAIPYFDTAGRTWLSKIWTPLVTWNADISELEPQLAKEWSSNDDATLWTFKLRDDVKFHDGEPFTAADVVFSLKLAINPEAATQFTSFSGLAADSVVDVRAVDDYTVEIELSQPSPRLPYIMVFLWILPEHALKDVKPAEYQNSPWFFTNPVGTGPFMHDEYQADQFWALKPNPYYWKGVPKLNRLINRYFADETAAILALESGEIQFSYASGDVALRLAAEDKYQVFPGPSGVTNYFIFNYRDPIFKDVRVRQAFLYAIDRKAITETVLQGTAEVVPCIGAFPSMWPDASELNDYAYNPDLARRLLQEAGWDSSRTVEIVTYYTSQFHLDAMAAQQAYLADVGVNITPLTQDVPTYNSYFYTGENWAISYRGVAANVANFPFNFYVKGGFETSDQMPLMGEEFPELNDLIQRARAEKDPEKYVGLLQDICRFQNQNAIEGYMWTATRYGIASKNLVDFYWFPGPGGGPYEDQAHLWSVSG